MPRPFSALITEKMNMFANMYGVIRVRRTGKGNLGPAIINIEESYELIQNIWDMICIQIGLFVPLFHGIQIPKKQCFQKFQLKK